MKIICVGMNYAPHIKELGDVEQEDIALFMKPDSALLRDNKPFFIPDFSSEVHYETELVLRINKLGKNIAPRFASRYYNEVGLGIDFTARDLQRSLRSRGLSWELCKGFDNSAAISSEFIPAEELDMNNISFRLDVNSVTRQIGNSSDMIHSFDEIVSYVSKFFTLKIGDLIFTGTPAGVGAVAIGDVLNGYIGDKQMFSFRIK